MFHTTNARLLSKPAVVASPAAPLPIPSASPASLPLPSPQQHSTAPRGTKHALKMRQAPRAARSPQNVCVCGGGTPRPKSQTECSQEARPKDNCAPTDPGQGSVGRPVEVCPLGMGTARSGRKGDTKAASPQGIAPTPRPGGPRSTAEGPWQAGSGRYTTPVKRKRHEGAHFVGLRGMRGEVCFVGWTGTTAPSHAI